MKKLLGMLVAGSCVASASATTVFMDTFDYADDAALAAVWDQGSANPSYTHDAAFGNPAGSYSMPSPAGSFQGRRAVNLGADYNPTNANPLVFSYDMYLPEDVAGAWNGARHYLELRGYAGDAFGSGGLENLVSMGIYNTSDDTFSTLSYQGRVTFGSNWNTLDEEAGAPTRSMGWHAMQIEITGDEIRFSVDGTLAEVEARPNGFGFDSIVLGSDLSANGWNVSVDNVKLEVVPEPATLALLALGGLAAFRRR